MMQTKKAWEAMRRTTLKNRGGTPKQHYACFGCRKMFRKPLDWSFPEQVKSAQQHQCAECGLPLRSMGVAFAPPPRGDVKQWKQLEKGYREGRQRMAMSRYLSSLRKTARGD